MSIIYEFERYVATKKTLRATLERYGVAIIPNVISAKECEAMVDGMWDTLHQLTQNFDSPIARDDESTWRSFYELFPMHSMLLQHWGVGHAPYIWKLRQTPKILDIWTHFWELKSRKDLLVSFDGASYHFPPEITKKGWLQPSSVWLHTDQSYTRNDFECVQSWVTGLDVNEGDGTLAILEGSHLYHGEFAKEFGICDKSDWYKLSSPEQLDFYVKKGCKRRSIKCPKGSMVFWDSRTIHSGQEPLKTRAIPNFRCIAYLCYAPRALCTPATLVKKQKYFEERRMTSHWPHKVKVFGKYPRTYGKPLPQITELPSPVLSSVGRCLAGYEPVTTNYLLDEEGYVIVDFVD